MEKAVAKIHRQMVSDPMHLQRILDELFEPEDAQKIDNLYRCYFWLAFAGFNESEALELDASCVNLDKMQIEYDVKYIGEGGKEESIRKTRPIYPEAKKAFENAVNLKDFVYVHEKPRYEIRRTRIAGTKLMRGVMANPSQASIRTYITKATWKRNAKVNETPLDFQISFKRMQMSGIFYRTYEKELAGHPVSLADEIEFILMTKYPDQDYSSDKRDIQWRKRRSNYKREYGNGYTKWKNAFIESKIERG